MEQDECPGTTWLRCNGVRFVDSGLVLEYAGMGGGVQDVGIAQSRYPLDRTNHYFEAEIIEGGAIGAVAIGLGKTTYPLHRHPGWNPGGVGYHADDGKLFTGKGRGDPFGPRCTAGDRMGCGIQFPVEAAEREEEGGASDSEESDSVAEGERAAVVLQSPYQSSGESEESDNSDVESEESYSDDSLLDQLMMHEPLRVPRLGGRGGVINLPGRDRGRPPWRDALLDAGWYNPPRIQLPVERGGGRSRRVNGGSGRTCTVYFTKNDERVGEVECEVPKGGFYPMVAMLSLGEKVRVNFNPLSG